MGSDFPFIVDETNLQNGLPPSDVDETPEPEEEEIVVIGRRISGGGGSWINLAGGEGQFDGLSDVSTFEPIDDLVYFLQPDDFAIDVTVDIDRPLTEDEKKALAALIKSIEDVTKAIDKLAPEGLFQLPNGQIVTGAELKELWAKADFKITDGQIGTAQVEFDGVARNPEITIDMGWLVYKDGITGGINTTILHELGHTVRVSQEAITAAYADGISTAAETQQWQRLANDVARAVAQYSGLALDLQTGGEYTEGEWRYYDPVQQ